jgi:hypothetical protein
MKITASQYAQSLLQVEAGGTVATKTLAKNFLLRLKKRGELGQVKKILVALEKLEARRTYCY